MTPDELATELEAGRVRSAYLLAGSEPLLREEAWSTLRRTVLGDGPADFDLDRLEGDEATPARLWDAVRTLPVLAERRLVWLREPGGGRGGWKALVEALPDVVGDVVSGSRTVLVVTTDAPDRRLAWVRAFADPAGALVLCDAPRPARELGAFVRREAKRLGLRIESDAVERLVERVGPQLLRLRSELEKASLLAGTGAPITLDHVTRGVADLAEEPVWELTDAIGEGRGGDALAVLAKLLATGVPPPVVLGALAGHFRKLVRVAHGGAVAGHPFALRKLQSQARRYARGRLVHALHALHETDQVLKGQGNLPADLALERLVIGLAP
jgi:DNA polymerase-3 subunit delta